MDLSPFKIDIILSLWILSNALWKSMNKDTLQAVSFLSLDELSEAQNMGDGGSARSKTTLGFVFKYLSILFATADNAVFVVVGTTGVSIFRYR